MSTVGQILDRQTRALTDAGCIRVFADKQSGKTADRPELAACLELTSGPAASAAIRSSCPGTPGPRLRAEQYEACRARRRVGLGAG